MGDFFMYNEIDFLLSLYKNSEMGIIGIDNLLSYEMNNKLRKILLRQRAEYIIICDDTENILKSFNVHKELNNYFSRFMTKIFTIMMIKDNDNNKMAKSMIQGSNRGIIKVNELINKTGKMSKKTKEVALDHLYLLQTNINELKAFL